jgi:hypothetical protein
MESRNCVLRRDLVTGKPDSCTRLQWRVPVMAGQRPLLYGSFRKSHVIGIVAFRKLAQFSLTTLVTTRAIRNQMDMSPEPIATGGPHIHSKRCLLFSKIFEISNAAITPDWRPAAFRTRRFTGGTRNLSKILIGTARHELGKVSGHISGRGGRRVRRRDMGELSYSPPTVHG